MRLTMKKNGFVLLVSLMTAFSFVENASFSCLNLVNPFRVLQLIFKESETEHLEKPQNPQKPQKPQEPQEPQEPQKPQKPQKPQESQETQETPKQEESQPQLGFQNIDAEGILSLGYVQIANDFYYFDLNTGYCVVDQWKKVMVNGKNNLFYFGHDGKQLQDVSSIIDQESPLLLKINTKINRIIVYTTDEENNYTVPVKVMICSAGKQSTPTKKGTYKLVKVERWHRLNGNVYGQYCCRITQHYLIHSVFYSQNHNPKTLNVREYNKLGNNASHGCVRVCVADAKWIYEQVDRITVWTTDEEEILPLNSPLLIPPIIVNGNKGIDPTDVEVNP